jgi:coiled-coil domain-containing protein 64
VIGLVKLLSFITQVSSQLIEAVQQKVALSQQLEEWEVDLQVMLQEQVKEKLVQNTANRSGNSSGI